MSEVWPFIPQVNLTEQLHWSSEVIRCRSAEQRIRLRAAPRTTIKSQYQLLPQEIEAATSFSRDFGADEFLFPFWKELEHVGTILSGAGNIQVSTVFTRYKVGGTAFIMGSDGSYEVVTIATVTPTEITLVAPFVVLGFAGAVVMPCFPARVKTPFRFKKYAADYFTSDLEVILTEDFELEGVNPYPAFNGSYVLTDRPLSIGSSSESHTREFEGFNNLAGPLFYSKSHTYSVGSGAMNWSFNTPAELWSFRLWAYIVGGKQGSFYAPRWTRDFVADLDLSTASDFVIVKRNTYRDDTYLGPVCIVKKDGTQVYLTVIGWELFTATQYKMLLSGQVGSNISVGEIEMITRMPKMRFNSDIFELSYNTGGTVDVRLPIMEVPE